MSNREDPITSFYSMLAQSVLAAQEKGTAPGEPSPSWRCTEPGVLALLGTRWRIEYAPHSHDYHPSCADYCVYEGRRLHGRAPTLAHAKRAAEEMQRELEQIGAE